MNEEDYQMLFCPECASDDINILVTTVTRHEVLGLKDGVLEISEAWDSADSDSRNGSELNCVTCGWHWVTARQVEYA